MLVEPGQKALRAAEVRCCRAPLHESAWAAATGVEGQLRGGATGGAQDSVRGEGVLFFPLGTKILQGGNGSQHLSLSSVSQRRSGAPSLDRTKVWPQERAIHTLALSGRAQHNRTEAAAGGRARHAVLLEELQASSCKPQPSPVPVKGARKP